MKLQPKILFIALLTILSCFTARTQPFIPDGEDIRVSWVTFYPGKEVYELEGHTALRISTPAWDIAVNYGLFDFNTPNFVYRFVSGQTDYCVGAIPWETMRASYTAEGRRIVERELNLTPSEKKQLLILIEENLRPENRTYRYNYVLDNCATRPLAIVEKAAGEKFNLPTPPEEKGVNTFRDIMRLYHRNYPWYQFGIDLALGWDIDKPIESRAHAFAPVSLDIAMENSIRTNGTPLTDRPVVINDVEWNNAVMAATPWYLTPLSVFTTFLLSVCIITLLDYRNKRTSRWLDTLLFGIYGLGGCLTFFLVFISEHYATTHNLVALWLNPSLLIISVGVWIKPWKKLVMWTQIVNFAIILVLIAAWPWLPQSANIAFLPAVLAEVVRLAFGINHNQLSIKKKTTAK